MLTLYFHFMLACVNKNCEDSTKSLTHELQAKVLGWPSKWSGGYFLVALEYHQGYYYGPFNVKKNGVLVKAFLEGHALDLLCTFKKITMAKNNKSTLKEDFLVNLVIRLSVKISSYVILKHKLLEFIKLVEIACVQVLKSMEDEQAFSWLNPLSNGAILIFVFQFTT